MHGIVLVVIACVDIGNKGLDVVHYDQSRRRLCRSLIEKYTQLVQYVTHLILWRRL